MAERDADRHQFWLNLGGGLVFLIIACSLLFLWFNHLDQQHDLKTKRVAACREIVDPANRTLCIVESK